MATSKKKIAVIGAGGLLGGALCKITDNKFEIKGFSHDDCDIADEKRVEDIFLRERPDFIINTAALTDVDSCEKNPILAAKVNADGPGNLAAVCKKINSKLIQFSTDYVFDGEKETAYIEEDGVNPISVYGQSKLDGERAVQNILNEHYIVRVSWLFGKKGKDFVDTIISRIDKNDRLRIIDDKFSIPTYSWDLSQAVLNLIQAMPEFGIYHISASGSCSWYEFAKEISKLYLGKEIEIEHMSLLDFDFAAKRPKNTILNCNKFTKAVGYSLRSWKDALKEYIGLCYKN